MTQAGPPCLVHDHEELIDHLAAGNARSALRVHNRHFDQIESSLLLDASHDEVAEVSTMYSELTNAPIDAETSRRF
jgi:hypothetical protein